MRIVEFSFNLLRKQYVSSNDRLHRMTLARRVADLVEMGRSAALERGVQMDIAMLTVSVNWPDRRSRDAPNIWPTIKALEDGLVRGGLLPDDNDKFIISTTFISLEERSGMKGITRVNLEFAGLVNPG